MGAGCPCQGVARCRGEAETQLVAGFAARPSLRSRHCLPPHGGGAEAQTLKQVFSPNNTWQSKVRLLQQGQLSPGGGRGKAETWRRDRKLPIPQGSRRRARRWHHHEAPRGQVRSSRPHPSLPPATITLFHQGKMLGPGRCQVRATQHCLWGSPHPSIRRSVSLSPYLTLPALPFPNPACPGPMGGIPLLSRALRFPNTGCLLITFTLLLLILKLVGPGGWLSLG